MTDDERRVSSSASGSDGQASAAFERVWGPDRAPRVISHLEHLSPELASLVGSHISSVYGDERLPMRERRLCTIAMLVALRCPAELRSHVRAAVRDGVPIEDIELVVLQCATYAGVPSAIEGMLVVKETRDHLVGRPERADG